jgi:hypothetical protein
MTSILPRALMGFGCFVAVVALLAVFYDAGTGEVGFNPAAKTALISGGACTALSILWAVLLRQGLLWARTAAIISTAFFLTAFTWRAIAGWMAFAAGQTEKWYASTLISSMWIAAAALLIVLLRYRGRGKEAEG